MMNNKIKQLLCLVLCCLFSYIGTCDNMYWQVNGNATVDGTSMQTFLVPYIEDDDNWNAIRVKIINSSGETLKILDIWGEDESGNRELWDGTYGAELFADTGDGHGWGTGNWATQSPIDDIDDLILNECRIVAELGHNTWNYDIDDADWQTLAISKSELIDESFKRTYVYDSPIPPPTYSQWTPIDFYTVPEPASGILFLVGTSLMMLKRQKRK